MKRIAKSYSLHLMCIIGLTIAAMTGAAWGQEEGFTFFPDAQARLFARINYARTNPLGAAREIGMDTQAILAAFPEMTDSLTNGLKPMIFNQRAYKAAENHTREMLELQYYSHISPLNGSTAADRLSAVGYNAKWSGETLGLVTFENFIDPVSAADYIFENMFRDELDPNREGQRRILNPDACEFAVCLTSGGLQIGQEKSNVYLATGVFACPEGISDLESELFVLINQAREYPLWVAQSMGMDTEALVLEIPENYDAAFTDGLDPLAWNDSLAEAADIYAQKYAETGYVASGFEENRDMVVRIQDTGYNAQKTGKSIVTGYISSSRYRELIYDLFAQVFIGGFDPLYADKRNFLDPEMTEIGIATSTTTLETEGEIRDVLIACIVFGKPADDRPAVLGIVFEDKDGDWLYDAGEGVSGLTVTIAGRHTAFGFEESMDFTTGGAGQFQSTEYKGLQEIAVIFREGEIAADQVSIQRKNSRALRFLLPCAE